jgi:hypothetical protein
LEVEAGERQVEADTLIWLWKEQTAQDQAKWKGMMSGPALLWLFFVSVRRMRRRAVVISFIM